MIQQATPPVADVIHLDPGIYRDMPDADYRRVCAISKSDLDKWADPTRDINPRNALMGTVFHAAILEPDIAREKVLVFSETRRGTKAWDACVDENPDKWIITPGEFDTIKGTVEAVKGHPEASRVRQHAIDNPTGTELVLVWRDESSGVLCKCKVDDVTPKAMIDWKTTGMYDSEKSSEAIATYGYDAQEAHYSAGHLACFGEVKPFAFIFASKRKDKGHPVWVHRATEAEMLSGQRTMKQLLALFARYNPDHPAVLNPGKE